MERFILQNHASIWLSSVSINLIVRLIRLNRNALSYVEFVATVTKLYTRNSFAFSVRGIKKIIWDSRCCDIHYFCIIILKTGSNKLSPISSNKLWRYMVRQIRKDVAGYNKRGYTNLGQWQGVFFDIWRAIENCLKCRRRYVSRRAHTRWQYSMEQWRYVDQSRYRVRYQSRYYYIFLFTGFGFYGLDYFRLILRNIFIHFHWSFRVWGIHAHK